MTLRPYQTDLVERLRKDWRRGKKAPCIVLPCGGGKSCIVAEIAGRTAENGKDVLFLVHRRELCDQIDRTFRWWGVDMRHCSVMMVQTACRRISKLRKPFLIITDENHHSKASSYRKVYDAFPDAFRVGVTATPVRLDGSGLGDVNDSLIIGVTAKWLIENHYLAPYDYYAPDVADLSTVKVRRGEFDARAAEKIMLESKVYGDVIKYYRKYADGMQAVCYCTTIRHSKEMAERFCAAGIDAAHIDGEMSKTERAEIVERFRRGALEVLCNVDLISEGFDVPDCSCVIMLRPTQSLTLFIQQAMRCMRYRPGKRAVILDHVGNYARHGMPDETREWSLEGKKKKQQNPRDAPSVFQCPHCFAAFRLYENGTRKDKCPNCGAELPKAEREEIQQDSRAELTRIVDFTVNPGTVDECRSYHELLAYAKSHGYKPGWAYYMAKEKGFLRSHKPE